MASDTSTTSSRPLDPSLEHDSWTTGHTQSTHDHRDSEPIHNPKPGTAFVDAYDSLTKDPGPARTLDTVRPSAPEASFVCGPLDISCTSAIRWHDPGPHKLQRRSHPQQLQQQQPTRLCSPLSRQNQVSQCGPLRSTPGTQRPLCG